MMIIDGKTCAKEISQNLIAKVDQLKEKGVKLKVAIVRVGEDGASGSYSRSIQKRAEQLGITTKEYAFDQKISSQDLVQAIDLLNHDDTISSIIVMQPLPAHIDDEAIVQAIDPKKDIDGQHPTNLGLLMKGLPAVAPNTALSVMTLLDYANVDLKGKNVVVIGRSTVIGLPVSQLLLQAHATVTTCHSKTQNLPEIARQADVLVVAVGREGFITEDFVHDQMVIIDVGTNYNDQGKLVGDVDFEAVQGKVKAITPVPGGVGAVTNVTMFDQLVNQYC